jgi:hypothetical protein
MMVIMVGRGLPQGQSFSAVTYPINAAGHGEEMRHCLKLCRLWNNYRGIGFEEFALLDEGCFTCRSPKKATSKEGSISPSRSQMRRHVNQ